MYVVAVTGPSDSGKTTLVEGLVDRLGARGPVGTVKHIACEPTLDTNGKDTSRHRTAGAVETYGIADTEWFATGDSLSLSAALERLSRTCEYAIIEGYHGAALPKVVLGEGDADGEILATASTADDIDLPTLVEQVAEAEPYETLSSLVEQAKRSSHADRAGAIATFTGRVREKNSPDDEPTTHLEFERYDTVAAEQTATIREELLARDGVYEVLLHHRTGVVEAGEDIVFVVVLAGHREEAFRTVEDGINRLKDEVPLFKKEITVEDEFWAHEQ